MPNSDGLRFNRPGLFSPSVIRNITQDVNGVMSFEKTDFTDVSTTAIGNTASFKYDLIGDGIKSTQQLNIDWSAFENHTFFNSAQVKVQVAFDKIINSFPFDGTQSETELFFDSLTGYEKYVYDQFPKNKGYLFFSGTNGLETTGGTYVTVKDVAGADFPLLSRTVSGISVLDPELDSMTLEFHLLLSEMSSSNQVILQKLSGSGVGSEYGFTVFTPTTGSTTSGSVNLTIVSGSYTISTSYEVQKGVFNHFAFVWNRNVGVNQIFMYVNQNLVNTSSAVEMTRLGFQAAPLIVGSGSTVTNIGFVPKYTLSGAMDELRIWHSIRTADERSEFERKAVYADDDLKLYFKFNEPSGSNTNLVIDYSSNSLHGVLSVSGTILGVREIPTGSLTTPMTYEKLSVSPILFPEHDDVMDLRLSELEKATEFDGSNPNLITKLVPKHYLLEGQAQDGLETEEGDILDTFTSNIVPRTGKKGDTQIILSMLWTWAKFFDEIKLYIQAFGDILHIEYDSDDTVPDQFLQFLADRYGVKLPPLFSGTSISQYVDAENIDNFISTNQYSLQFIQNQIWRRILINLRDIMTSKGTIHSVKAFMRTLGIDPDNNFRIREFGGPTKKALAESRESRTEISTMLNFVSGGYLFSPFLSSSRIEPGLPYTSSTPANANDGLLTSGSWTVEATVRFNTGSVGAQSIVRMHTTGSGILGTNLLVANLVATSGSDLTLYMGVDAVESGSDSVFSLQLTGATDLFDGNLWNVSFGRTRNDLTGSTVSSSYFLRTAKNNFSGEILEEYTTSSFFLETRLTSSNILSNLTASKNVSGSFLVVGSQSVLTVSAFLNNNLFSDAVRTTAFDGRIGHIRFWSKALELNEWREHVRNFKSLGVQDPSKNFNFVTNISGSWERLRLDVTTDQETTSSDTSGRILLGDFSQNHFNMSGTLFPLTKSIVEPQRFYFSHISAKFDEAATTNKVRIRGFSNANNIIENNNGSFVGAAPVYQIEKSETPTDNTRFTIDFSIVDALNQDMIGIFATLDALDNAIGNPELVFSMDYPKLEVLRDVYFNRLTDKINLKNFFEFFKWFDTNIGTFIAQLIPRKTKYLGTNFVIESHMLERPKMEYFFSDIYIGENHRHALKDTILLQQFVSIFARY